MEPDARGSGLAILADRPRATGALGTMATLGDFGGVLAKTHTGGCHRWGRRTNPSSRDVPVTVSVRST